MEFVFFPPLKRFGIFSPHFLSFKKRFGPYGGEKGETMKDFQKISSIHGTKTILPKNFSKITQNFDLRGENLKGLKKFPPGGEIMKRF